MVKILQFKKREKSTQDEAELVKSVLKGVLSIEEIEQLKKELSNPETPPDNSGKSTFEAIFLLLSIAILALLAGLNAYIGF